MAPPSSYPVELRKRAVRMVAEVRGDYPNESAALRAVAQKLGIGSAEPLRNWVKRDEVDSGKRPGTTTEESAQIKAMTKEIAELKRANDILKAAAGFFAAELDRPHTLVASIDEHRARFGGVEPICRVLTDYGCKIASSTYYTTASDSRPRPPAMSAMPS
ncbi:transposase [Streptomyces sp. NBC_01218]|uniref:transposase n=1 Tax=Streptomyces sp. NBC_01218 TaxID=2903780 RepID=UPI002E10F297|nr:transposase [Streptomyces sp. NBC_01218]